MLKNAFILFQIFCLALTMACGNALLRRLPQLEPAAGEFRFPAEMMWKKRLPGSPGSYLTSIDSLVMAHTGNGHIVLLNIQTGDKVWQKNFRRRSGIMPVPDDSLLFIAWRSGEPALCAVDYITGREIWSRDSGPQSAVPCTDGHLIFTGSENGMLSAFRKRSGDTHWQVRLGGPVRGIVPAGDSLIAVVIESGGVRLLSKTDGQNVLQLTLEPEIAAAPIYNNGRLYLGNTEGRVWAVRTTDGAILWQKQVLGGIFNPGAADTASVYWVTSAGVITALRSNTGEALWCRHLGAAAGSAPADLGDAIVLGLQDRRLMVFNKQDGRVIWETRCRGRVKTTPVFRDRIMIACSDHDWMYAYRSRE